MYAQDAVLSTRTSRIGKSAQCPRRFGGEANEHVVQALMTDGNKKMLDIWTGKAIKRLKAQGSIFSDARSANLNT